MQPDHSPHRERLWTPWRMRYIGGDAREDGCIFCNRLAGDDDVSSLILHRSRHAFVIMNLYPYNTGHVMVVPNAHQADLDALDEATMIDMATLLPKVVVALRQVLACDGFNIGLNLGADAGAGVAAHLHQHVVPRWEGDANFMPILAGTMVIPEVIPATYAKLRAQFARVLFDARRFDTVVVSDMDRPTAWLRDGRVPSVTVNGDAPVFRASLREIGIDGAETVGWSGGTHSSDRDTPPGLVIRIDAVPDGSGWGPVPLDELDSLDPDTAATLERARTHLAPWIAAGGDHP